MKSRLRRRGSIERAEAGFSMLELLVSVSVLTILMAMVFQFLAVNQRRYRSMQLLSEVHQGGRSAFEIMTQELNQAGYNPPFRVHRSVGGSGAVTPAAPLVSLPVTGGGTSPSTRGIFYGSVLVVGNACTGAAPEVCNQEEVVVNADGNLSQTAITATSVPVVLAGVHQAGEPIFSRNYPYPNGVLYDNRLPGEGLGVTDNKVRFFGDIMDTGDLYYGEYRLQCPGSVAGTYVDACTTGCTEGPFTLTRFVTRLADPSTGVFRIPTSRVTALDGATVSPLVSNIMGTCATVTGSPGSAPSWNQWTVYNAPDQTAGGTTPVNATIDYSTATYVPPVLNADGVPAIWFKVNTYGNYDTSQTPARPFFQTYVLDVRLTLTVQQAQVDPETGTRRVQRLQTHIVPRNVNDALTIARSGGSMFLPAVPTDPTQCTGSPPNRVCNTLPLP
jgi:prepilin-type N-terminal cleavage/methylation domain-containing protein